MTTHLSAIPLEQMSPEVQGLVRPAFERLGYVGEFYKYSAHAPDVLLAFAGLTSTLRSAIPAELNELIALTVCSRLDFAYERIQHERLALTLGLEKAWIARLIGRSDAFVLSEPHRRLFDFVVAVLEGESSAARSRFGFVIEDHGEAAATAILYQVTRFQSICTIGRLLDLPPPAASIFDVTD